MRSQGKFLDVNSDDSFSIAKVVSEGFDYDAFIVEGLKSCTAERMRPKSKLSFALCEGFSPFDTERSYCCQVKVSKLVISLHRWKLLSVITGQKSKLEKIHRELDRIFDVIIYEHQVRREAIKNSESQGFRRMDVFGAGTETSSSTVEWAMSELLKNQRVMEKAQVGVRQVCSRKGNFDETDLHELKLAIKETLRVNPPYTYVASKGMPRKINPLQQFFSSAVKLQCTPLLLPFLLFLFMVFKIAKKNKFKTSSPKLPPGPWKLPLIGNLHQLTVAGTLPHHTLRRIAGKYGPLMHLQLGEVSTIIVTSAEIAQEVLKTHDIIFAQRPFVLAASALTYDATDIVWSPYGDYWRVATNAENMCDGNSKLKASPNISGAAFGKKRKYQEEFISLVEEGMVLVGGFNIVDVYPSVKLLERITGIRHTLEKMHKKLDQIVENIVREHKERKKTEREKGEAEGEDLVDVLLRIQKQGDLEFQLTDNNVKAVILDIFSVGSETSTTVVEWAMSELLKNPQQMKRAQDEVRNVFKKKGNVVETGLHELKYLNAVVKETLRLHPSAPLLVPRESSEKCMVNGYEIPAKTRVIVNAWATGQDPRYWTEAERFDPERFIDSEIDFKGRDFKYIPFGAGRRICPGMSFALPNMELPLAQLLYHFDWKLPNGMKHEELDMEERFGVTVQRKNDLYLIPIPYDRLSSV
ncbi:hypothetical protein Vadar_012645 [Vaccinium darrowii]|uniref:Uncharacterized protein n=1 Tax=Vaccinium darrowii TaxID=229202 RepID=A0ACB7XQ68_9ERIC|nr:hypothetical protein Vadar_012645 [Vaccinium darrowii]